MDDELISIAEAAKRIGLNRSTLTRQAKDGMIRSHNGKVRLSEVLEDRANNIDLAKGRRTGRPDPVPWSPEPEAAPARRAAPQPSAPDEAEDEDLVLVDGELLSTAEAVRLKENYLGKLRQLEFDTKSGRLIDAHAAEAKVFALARAERDALVNWPARVAPLIAAELGVDQVVLAVALEKHVRDFLSDRSEPRVQLAG